MQRYCISPPLKTNQVLVASIQESDMVCRLQIQIQDEEKSIQDICDQMKHLIKAFIIIPRLNSEAQFHIMGRESNGNVF